MELREPEPDDAERIRELVNSAFTSSYRLSPQQIDAITREEFGDDRLEERFDSSDAVALVATTDESVDGRVVVGYAEGRLDDETGELRWLFVDPEHYGRGMGTELFETVSEELHDRGAERVLMTVLEASNEGHQFVERFGFEHKGEREVELGDEALVHYVYAEDADDVEATEDEAGEPEEEDERFPDTEERDGQTVATTEDGREVYLAREEERSGTAGSFFTAYADEDLTEEFGYYCENCGSLDVSMDNMERLECGDCGNSHASRSDEAYDESHL